MKEAKNFWPNLRELFGALLDCSFSLTSWQDAAKEHSNSQVSTFGGKGFLHVIQNKSNASDKYPFCYKHRQHSNELKSEVSEATNCFCLCVSDMHVFRATNLTFPPPPFFFTDLRVHNSFVSAFTVQLVSFFSRFSALSPGAQRKAFIQENTTALRAGRSFVHNFLLTIFRRPLSVLLDKNTKKKRVVRLLKGRFDLYNSSTFPRQHSQFRHKTKQRSADVNWTDGPSLNLKFKFFIGTTQTTCTGKLDGLTPKLNASSFSNLQIMPFLKFSGDSLHSWRRVQCGFVRWLFSHLLSVDIFSIAPLYPAGWGQMNGTHQRSAWKTAPHWVRFAAKNLDLYIERVYIDLDLRIQVVCKCLKQNGSERKIWVWTHRP